MTNHEKLPQSDVDHSTPHPRHITGVEPAEALDLERSLMGDVIYREGVDLGTGDLVLDDAPDEKG